MGQPANSKLSLSLQQEKDNSFKSGKIRQRKDRDGLRHIHILCPRFSEHLTPTGLTATRLWKTSTITSKRLINAGRPAFWLPGFVGFVF